MSEVKDKTLGMLETLVKQNNNIIEMASKIKDPSQRKELLDRLDQQIGRSQKLVKELK